MARFWAGHVAPCVCVYLMTRLFKDIVTITLVGWPVGNSDKNGYGFWLGYFCPNGFITEGYYAQSAIKSKVLSNK